MPSEVYDIDPATESPTGIDEDSKISVLQCYFSMFKVYCGVAILALPSALKDVGVFGGNLIIIISGILNYYTIKL